MNDKLEGVEEVKKNRPTVYSEQGTLGLERYGGYMREEFLSQLQMAQGLKVYREMKDNDATVGAVLYTMEMFIRKVAWKVKEASSAAIDILAKDYVKENMFDMSMTWDNTMSDILTMFPYGWSWHELVYKRRMGYHRNDVKNSEFDDGMVGWARIPIRSQSSWHQWVFEEDSDDIKAMIQDTGMSKQVILPIQKALHFKTTSARGNPEGRSLLRNAYRPWYFKRHLEEIEGIGAERDLAGLPVMTAPEDVSIWDPNDDESVTLLTHVKKIIRNIRRDQQDGVVKPFGWELSLLSTGGSRTIDTNQIINRYDQRIAVSLLADIILLGADKVGSFALADVKKSLLTIALEGHLENIAETFNRYAIPRLLRLNPRFAGITGYPRLVPGNAETPDLRELGRYIQVLSGARPGFMDEITEDYLRMIAGLPRVDEIPKIPKLVIEEEEEEEEDDENKGSNGDKDKEVKEGDEDAN